MTTTLGFQDKVGPSFAWYLAADFDRLVYQYINLSNVRIVLYSTEQMAKRPVSAVGNRRPTSEFARMQASMGGNPRYKVSMGGNPRYKVGIITFNLYLHKTSALRVNRP